MQADGNQPSWRWDEPAPRRRTLEDLREAVSLLRKADRLRQDGDEKSAESIEKEAAKLGFHKYSPLMNTGLHMQAGLGYDGMHSIANVSKAWRDALMGHGLLSKTGTSWRHLLYEEEVNSRFVGAGKELQKGVEVKVVIRRGLLPYVLTDDEKNIIRYRGTRALESGLLHASFKGSKVFESFNPENVKGSLLPLKCSDAHVLMGPVGLYLIGGLCDRNYEKEPITGTYAEVYCQFMKAMNYLRKKSLSPGEAQSVQKLIATAFSYLYLVFPTFEFDHSFHQVWEVASQVPIHVAANWGGERNLRTVRDKHKNNAAASTTINRALQRYLGVWTRDMSIQSQGGDEERTRYLNGQSSFKLTSEFDRDHDQDDLYQVIPDAEGNDVIFSGRVRQTRVMDVHLQASLWMYYLQTDDWAGSDELHNLVKMFVEDGGQDPIAAVGCEAKVAAMHSMRHWYDASPGHINENWWPLRQQRQLDRGVDNVLYMDLHYTESSRVSIGSFRLRTRDLDETCKTSSSYFLARVEGAAGEQYELGRAIKFIRHLPPGSSCTGKDDVFFVVAKWLIPTVPRNTNTSGLPMVVLDDSPDVYLRDEDSADKMITDVWPLHGVVNSPVCLAPLDNCHDIPDNTAVRQGPPGPKRQANQILRKMTRRKSKSIMNQTETAPGSTIAAVICMYCDMNDRF